jgi:tetratricopeptide (TPR) repeat protein
MGKTGTATASKDDKSTDKSSGNANPAISKGSKLPHAAGGHGKDDRVVLVEERSSKPPGGTKFIRKKLEDVLSAAQSLSGHADLNGYETVTDEDFCQSLLVAGYVQSYVDFYHLSHRIDPNAGDGSTTNKIIISHDDMRFIRDNLVAAESARRQGNTAGVYTAYTKLADYYVQRSDWRTSIYFHEKCLEVAKLTTDSRAEIAALHASGCVCQKMGDHESALKFHEREEEQARQFDVVEEIKHANVELFRVYMVLAEKLEAVGQYDEALDYYHLCLDASRKCWDRNSEGEANGKIGTLLLARKQAQEALPYLREYSQISADMGSAEGRCKACSALAIALDTLGQSDKALIELKVVQTTSEQSGDVILQAQASRALGTLFSKVGNFDQALDAFQRHFTLLKSILMLRNQSHQVVTSIGGTSDDYLSGAATAAAVVTASDLDQARTLVGIARGNLIMGQYVMVIESDLANLLDWKLSRTELPDMH